MQVLKRSSVAAVAAVAAAWFLAGMTTVYGASIQDDSRPVEAADADSAEEPDSFEEAIDSLYEGSGIISDEEILQRAKAIRSDESELYSGLEPGTAEAAAKALAAYEQAKVDYICARVNGNGGGKREQAVQVFADAGTGETGEAVREWDLQSAYAKLLIGEESGLRELVPRYRVTSCRQTGEILELDVEEWMTQGYGAADGSGAVSASAYSYTFTLSLRRGGENSAWTPFAINGTESNFTWLRDEVDPASLTQEAPASLYAVQSDLETGTVAWAQIGTGADNAQEAGAGSRDGSDRKADGEDWLSFEIDRNAAVLPSGTDAADEAADAQLYSAATAAYSYSPAKAAAYADKYWKHYNHSYREYRGVDCANFVSQCLYAGGMPRTSDWYPQSVNWINVMGHIRHFKSYGTFVTAANTNVRRGNPVYYDWNGDGTYDHTALCVGTNASGMPVVDAHTNNVYHAAWRMGSGGKRGTIVLRSRSTVSASKTSVTVEKNKWKTISGKVYYLDGNGKTVRSRFLTIGGKRYYFNASGVRVTGSFKVGKYWYYADPSNGALVTGWKKLSGKYRYYSTVTYRRLDSGRYRIAGSYYFFNSRGERQVSFILIGKNWYYADKKTGKFITGWRKIHHEWYYFDKKTMVKAIGWKTIDGKKCYFDSYGILKKGKHG